MKTYTKTGDNGKTSVNGLKRLPKSEIIFDTLGTLDELNTSLGFLHTIRNKKIKSIIVDVQMDLLSIGSIVSEKKVELDLEKKVLALEETLDIYEQKLPELKSFIIPGGSKFSVSFHTSRVVCRRLERKLVEYENSTSKDIGVILTYVNRLSDLLFVLARYVNFKLGIKELLWKTKRTRNT